MTQNTKQKRKTKINEYPFCLCFTDSSLKKHIKLAFYVIIVARSNVV